MKRKTAASVRLDHEQELHNLRRSFFTLALQALEKLEVKELTLTITRKVQADV